MDDKDLFGNSSDQFGFSGGSSLPDPAAAPSTYDSDFLNGSSTTLGGLDNIPDPAASPDSYQDFDIPEIDSDFDVPDVDDIVISAPTAPPPPPVSPVPPMPKPAAPAPKPQTFRQPQVNADPVLPDKSGAFDYSSDDFPMPGVGEPKPAQRTARPAAPDAQNAESGDFTGHMSWNGLQYVESETPPPRSAAVPDSDDPRPVVFTMNRQNGNAFGGQNITDVTSRINTIKVLAITGIILTFFGCGCSFLGVILGIAGNNMAKKLADSTPGMTDEEKSKLKTAKTLCTVSIVLSLLIFFGSFLLGFLGALL